jgi:hypothetical protein
MTESFDDLRIVQRTDGGPPIEASIEEREDGTRMEPLRGTQLIQQWRPTPTSRSVPSGMKRTPRRSTWDLVGGSRGADRLFDGEAAVLHVMG